MSKIFALAGGFGLVTASLITAPLDGQGRSSSVDIAPKMQRAVSGATKVNSVFLQGGILANVDVKTGQVTANPSPIEIRILLPDQYLRSSQWGGLLRQIGFSGLVPLSAMTALNPGVTANTPTISDAYLASLHAAAARFILGVAGVLDGPLALRADAGPTSTTFHVTDPSGFDCYLDVASDTAMPLRIRYEGTVFFYTPPSSGQERAEQRAEKAELTLTFSERRSVGGAMLPHRITLTARSLVNGQTYTQEDIRVESALVNSLTKADFKFK